MHDNLYVGVDVGTASVRAALVSSEGRILKLASEALQIWHPLPEKYYEQSSDDVWRQLCQVVKVSGSQFLPVIRILFSSQKK